MRSSRRDLIQKALNANGWKVSIKLVSADTETSAVGAASAARKSFLAQGSDCIVGALTSSETITAAQSVVIRKVSSDGVSVSNIGHHYDSPG